VFTVFIRMRSAPAIRFFCSGVYAMDDSTSAESPASLTVASGETRIVNADFSVKVILAVLSLLAFAYLTGSWELGVIVLTGIGWHEYGHVCAMRREGMQTGGFYFLPFLGGVALAKGEAPSRAADIRISLAGPLFGLSMCFATMGLYVVTQQPVFAVAALINGAINIFNLVPVYPLDGGRVVRAMVVGSSSYRARVFFIVTMTSIAILALVIPLPLALIIGMMAHFSLVADIKRLMNQEQKNALFSTIADCISSLEKEGCLGREIFPQRIKEEIEQNKKACAQLRFSEGFYGAVMFSVLIVAFLAVISLTMSVPGVEDFKPG
jgi:Zn-dependent protease